MSWNCRYSGKQSEIRDLVANDVNSQNMPDDVKRGVDEILLSLTPEARIIFESEGHLSETREGNMTFSIKRVMNS